MEIVWQIAAVLLAGYAGAIVGRKSSRCIRVNTGRYIPECATHILIITLFLVALPFLNVYLTSNPSLAWSFPWWLQVHYLPVFWGTISSLLAYVFGFCCYPSLASRTRGMWGQLAFAVTALGLLQLYSWGHLRLGRLELGPGKITSEGVILQSDPSSCVPAAAANIAIGLGVNTSEKELAKLFYTTKEGTYPGQAALGMAKLGIQATRSECNGDIRKVAPPAMLFVLGDIHAVAFLGITNEKAIVVDPSCGKQLMSVLALQRRWDGHAIEFQSRSAHGR